MNQNNTLENQHSLPPVFDELGEDLSKEELKRQVEAILFASTKPLSGNEILELIKNPHVNYKSVMEAINDIYEEFKTRNGGFNLFVTEGPCYQFRTQADLSFLLERLFANKPRPLSRAAQETLAIIAYRQPVTRADIEFIRGVDAGSILKNLLERDLVACVGRKEDSGRPMLFATTEEFLRIYGLKKLEDLPPLDSFQPKQEMLEQASENFKNYQKISDEGITEYQPI